MNLRASARLTVDEFLAWSAKQEDCRAELVNGEIVAMAAETVRHNRHKSRAVRALGDGVVEAGLSCEAFGDGIAVRIDAHSCRIPDASVQCGPVDPDSLELSNPVIVVEVVSPSSERGDTGTKVGDYFRVPSIRHYLILDPYSRGAVLHSRETDGGSIATSVFSTGPIRFDPPGFSVQAEDLLAPTGDE